jgi:hypothetical protein
MLRWKMRDVRVGERTKVQKALSEYIAAIVVGVKVHVESINVAVAFIINDDSRRCRPVSLSRCIRLGAFDPLRISGHVVIGGQPDVAAHLIEIGGGERLGGTGDLIEINPRSGVVEERLYVCRHILVI